MNVRERSFWMDSSLERRHSDSLTLCSIWQEALPTRLIVIDLVALSLLVAGGYWALREADALDWYGVAIFAGFDGVCLLLALEQPPALPLDLALIAAFVPIISLQPAAAVAAIALGLLIAAAVSAVWRRVRPRTRWRASCGVRALMRTVTVVSALALAAVGAYMALGGDPPIAVSDTTPTLGGLLRAVAILTAALAVVIVLRQVLAPVSMPRLALAQAWSLLVAVLTGWSYSPHVNSPGIAALTVGGVAAALGLIVVVARMQSTLDRRSSELAVLNWVGHVVTTQPSPEALFEELHRRVETICDAPIFSIALYDAKRGRVSYPYVREHGAVRELPDGPPGDSPTARVIRSRRSLLLAGNAAARAYAEHECAFPLACYLGIPLIAGDDVIGAIAIQHDTDPHAYGPYERELLEAIAPQAAIALRNARLFEEAQTLSTDLQELVASSREFSATLDVSALAQSIVRRLHTAASRPVTLLEWNPETSTLQHLAHFPPDFGELDERLLEEHGATLREQIRSPEPLTLSVEREGAVWQASVMPLIARERPVGMAIIWNQPADTSSPGASRLIEGLIHQAAVALQNAQTYSRADASLRERVIELSAIEVISRHMSATLDIETIINDVLAAAMSAIDAALGACGLVLDEEHFMLVAMLDQGGEQMELPVAKHISYGMARRVLLGHETVVCGDILAEPDYTPLFEGMRSELCVPILREGRSVGLLAFYDPRPNAFTDAQMRFVSTLAEHASIALENARLFIDRRRQVETLVTLRRISTEFLAAAGREQIAEKIADFARETLRTHCVAVYWVDADDSGTRLAPAWEGIAPPDDLVHDVIASGQAAYSVDLDRLPVFHTFMPLPDFEARACVPIRRGDHTLGVIDVTITDSLCYTQSEIQALEVLAGQAAVAIESIRLNNIVRAGRDQLQAVLNSTREGILLFDLKGRLLLVNPAAEEMLGAPLASVVGVHYLDWLRTQRPDQLEALTGHSLAGLRRYLQNVIREPGRVMRRQFMQQREGGTRYIDEIGTPVLDERGETVIGWMLVWRDITEERKLNDLRQELSSMIVHDLRSPLTAIISSLTLLNDLLEEDALDRETLAEVIGIARLSSDSMLRLVESLLDIARLEQNRVALDLSICHLQDVVDSAYTAVMSLALEAEIAIEVNLPDDLPPVWIDMAQIHRVLVNLLDNALRHTPYGGKVLIEAERLQDADAVCVSVSDSGPGIPVEARAAVFEKFSQLDKSAVRGHKGSGLGLTFCKLVVEAHGGEIWVDDAALGGAAFRFTLPLADNRSRQTHPAASSGTNHSH